MRSVIGMLVTTILAATVTAAAWAQSAQTPTLKVGDMAPDKAGKVAAIDTNVRPPTSAEDMIAKLDELKIATR
jgi:hypothetical protein